LFDFFSKKWLISKEKKIMILRRLMMSRQRSPPSQAATPWSSPIPHGARRKSKRRDSSPNRIPPLRIPRARQPISFEITTSLGPAPPPAHSRQATSSKRPFQAHRPALLPESPTHEPTGAGAWARGRRPGSRFNRGKGLRPLIPHCSGLSARLTLLS
jgi:hypothetical protein